MDSQSLEEGSIGNVSIHDLPGPEPGQELELLDSVHARYEGESVEGPNQQGWSKGPCGTTFCYCQSELYDIGTKILLLQ